MIYNIDQQRRKENRVRITFENKGGSSRGHLFFMFDIRNKNDNKTSKLTFVDMGGNETPLLYFKSNCYKGLSPENSDIQIETATRDAADGMRNFMFQAYSWLEAPFDTFIP